MKKILVLILFITVQFSAYAQNSSVKPDGGHTQQSSDVKYRLFKTENVFTMLLLDTSTGKVWQTQFSVNEEKGTRLMIPINDRSLVRSEEITRVGRFTLYPTLNMYNFMLLDQDTGRLFQCQWSLKKEERIILSIEPWPEEQKKN